MVNEYKLLLLKLVLNLVSLIVLYTKKNALILDTRGNHHPYH